MVATPTSIFIAGIFPAHRDRLLRSATVIRPEMLADEHSRFLYAAALAYMDKYGDVPSQQVVRQIMVAQKDSGEAAAMWQTYAMACNNVISDHEHAYAVDELVDAATRRQTGEALAVAFEILESGYQIGKETLQGHEQAREYLSSQMVEIARTGAVQEASEVPLSEDVGNVWAEYIRRKNAPDEASIKLGVGALDDHSGGIQTGELMLVAAYTNHGKSQFCVNAAWAAAIEQGKNVFYSTSETMRADITNRFVARHSRLPQFGMPEGLDSSKIRRGLLNANEEKIMLHVLEDLRSNPAYGRFHVSQIPRGATLNFVETRMLQKHHEWGIDLAINDYLNLLTPERSRGTQREEASDILKDAKVLSTSFAGTGVAFISPWQINRTGYQAAQSSQMYSMDSLSEASEAEKSSDLVLTLLYNPSMDAKRVAMQLLKNRNGALMAKTELMVDYRNSYFASTAGAANGATGGSMLGVGGLVR